MENCLFDNEEAFGHHSACEKLTQNLSLKNNWQLENSPNWDNLKTKFNEIIGMALSVCDLKDLLIVHKERTKWWKTYFYKLFLKWDKWSDEQ